MKLVTFNIRCDYGQDGENNFIFRKPMILDKLNKENPDIICFQEVVPHVALWLKENLKDYYVIGCGRDENLKGEQTTIAYKKLKFVLIGMEVFWLSETPKLPGSRYQDQSMYPRVCTEALFQDMDTNEVFRVFNTHLDHEGSEARKLGLGQILEKIQQEVSFVKAPVILTGDFNCLPDSPEMELLKEYPCLIDLTAEIGGTFHNYGELKEPVKIDYIIAQDNFECSSASLWEDCKEGVYLSDHYPVSVELYNK
jgi:endonuclease/exonuclease/phosphatase family metal-dependent hydrolase